MEFIRTFQGNQQVLYDFVSSGFSVSQLLYD